MLILNHILDQLVAKRMCHFGIYKHLTEDRDVSASYSCMVSFDIYCILFPYPPFYPRTNLHVSNSVKSVSLNHCHCLNYSDV